MTTEMLSSQRADARAWWSPRALHVRSLPTLGAALVAAVGLIVLAGWLLGVDALKSMGPSNLTMKANTAACFVLLGAATACVAARGSNLTGRRAGSILAGSAGLIGLATLAEYLGGLDFGIDQAFFRDTSSLLGTAFPGRMSPFTSICFVALGAAVVLACGGPRLRRFLVPCAALALAVSVLNIFDFVFDAGVPTFIAGYTQMAINTSIAMAILALAVSGLLGAAHPLAPMAGSSATAVLLRNVLAVSIGGPVILAWLRLEGQRLGFYDTSYGTALMLVGILAVSVTVILRSAGWITRVDARRANLEIERDRFFNVSLDLLCVTGTDGRFRRTNRAWSTVLGYAPDELVGTRAVELVHPDDLERTLDIARRHHHDGESLLGFQNRYRHKDGTYRWLEWMSQAAPDGDLSFGVARDISSRKLDEERGSRLQHALEARNKRLTERAVRDPLTGLHNRRFFDEARTRIDRRWARLAPGERGPVAVIIFDLDHFGQVNKQHGHQAGDAVLRLFGGLLVKRFREGDLVARYGGEEFVAILEGAPVAVAVRIAEGIRTELEAAAVDIGSGEPLRVTVSAGCAQLGEGDDIAAGLTLADVWLSQAKRSGRNQVVGL